jgi:hypothetical protein
MAKNRQAITCNGKQAFFASMYEDIRKSAIDCGWAVALHGSLASDMDIMAMPWTEEAIKFEALVGKISMLFDDNSLAENYTITYDEKPHHRVVATIPIWADFYLDISTIDTRKPMDDIVERLEDLQQPCYECRESCNEKCVIERAIEIVKAVINK